MPQGINKMRKKAHSTRSCVHLFGRGASRVFESTQYWKQPTTSMAATLTKSVVNLAAIREYVSFPPRFHFVPTFCTQFFVPLVMNFQFLKLNFEWKKKYLQSRKELADILDSVSPKFVMQLDYFYSSAAISFVFS
jgi:hypothetical protein